MVGSVRGHIEAPIAPIAPFTRRISWSAIFGGLAVSLVVELLLSLLGIGIGASTIHPTSANGASAQSVGLGSAIWFVVATLVSLFAGGWVAGHLAGIPRRTDAALHGIIAWSLTSLFTVYLLTTAVGGVISGATGALGTLFSTAGAGIASAAPGASKAIGDQVSKSGVTPDDVTTKAQQLLSETGNAKLSPTALQAQGKHEANLAKGSAKGAALDPQNAKANYNDLVYRFLHDTGVTSRSADRRALINVVASEQHISKAQAATTVDGWTRQAQNAEQQANQIAGQVQQSAKQAGDATAGAIAKAALSGFGLFLLGGIAAALGGLASVGSILSESVLVEKRNSYVTENVSGESRAHQHV